MDVLVRKRALGANSSAEKIDETWLDRGASENFVRESRDVMTYK